MVSGGDANTFLDRLSANRLPTKTGNIRLCHFLNQRGTVECEFTITLLEDDSYYLVYAAIAEQHHLDWLNRHRDDATDAQKLLSRHLGAQGANSSR